MCPFHCTSEPFIKINFVKCGSGGGSSSSSSSNSSSSSSGSGSGSSSSSSSNNNNNNVVSRLRISGFIRLLLPYACVGYMGQLYLLHN